MTGRRRLFSRFLAGAAVPTVLVTRGSCCCVSFRFVLGSDSLVISEVTESDEGLYACIVNTTLDHVSASAKLTVVGRSRPFILTSSQ